MSAGDIHERVRRAPTGTGQLVVFIKRIIALFHMVFLVCSGDIESSSGSWERIRNAKSCLVAYIVYLDPQACLTWFRSY